MKNRWIAFGFVLFLAACGGGGGGSSVPAPVTTTPPATATPSPTPTPTPTPTATPFAGPSASGTTTVPASGNLVATLPTVAGYGGSLSITGPGGTGVTSGLGTTVTGTISLGPIPPLIPFTSSPPVVVNQVLVYAAFALSSAVTVPGTSTATITFSFPPNTLQNTPYYYATWFPCSGICWIGSTSQGPFPVTTTDFGAGQTITIIGQPSFTFSGSPFVYGFVVYR